MCSFKICRSEIHMEDPMYLKKNPVVSHNLCICRRVDIGYSRQLLIPAGIRPWEESYSVVI